MHVYTDANLNVKCMGKAVLHISEFLHSSSLTCCLNISKIKRFSSTAWTLNRTQIILVPKYHNMRSSQYHQQNIWHVTVAYTKLEQRLNAKIKLTQLHNHKPSTHMLTFTVEQTTDSNITHQEGYEAESWSFNLALEAEIIWLHNKKMFYFSD